MSELRVSCECRLVADLDVDSEIERARIAIDRLDLEGALEPLTQAFARDIEDERAIELLKTWVPLAAGRLDAIVDAATEKLPVVQMLRPLIYFLSGAHDAAIKELLWVSLAASQPLLETWGLAWLESDLSLAQVFPPQAAELCAAILAKPRQRHSVERVLDLLDRIERVFPDARVRFEGKQRLVRLQADRVLEDLIEIPAEARAIELTHLRSKALARLGRFDEGVAVARARYAERPTYERAIVLGLALLRAGDRSGGRSYFVQAVLRNPDDCHVRLDLGDMALEKGDFNEALNWYSSVLLKKSGHPWAMPSALYCRFMLSADATWLQKLSRVARDLERAQGHDPKGLVRALELLGRAGRP